MHAARESRSRPVSIRRVRPCRISARRAAAAGIAAVLVLSVASCDARQEEPRRPTAGSTYSVPTRDAATLRRELVSTCEAALRSDNPRVLIEFSAAWCSDCRRLDAMKQSPALAAELAAWSHLAIDVGRFDRHRDLLDALAVETIAHWSIFEPARCDAPLPEWPRAARRTLEVSSGDERDLSPADLAAWLAAIRRP